MSTSAIRKSAPAKPAAGKAAAKPITPPMPMPATVLGVTTATVTADNTAKAYATRETSRIDLAVRVAVLVMGGASLDNVAKACGIVHREDNGKRPNGAVKNVKGTGNGASLYPYYAAGLMLLRIGATATTADGTVALWLANDTATRSAKGFGAALAAANGGPVSDKVRGAAFAKLLHKSAKAVQDTPKAKREPSKVERTPATDTGRATAAATLLAAIRDGAKVDPTVLKSILAQVHRLGSEAVAAGKITPADLTPVVASVVAKRTAAKRTAAASKPSSEGTSLSVAQ